MFKILVCGGRTFGDIPIKSHPLYEEKHKEYLFVWNTLISLCQEKGFLDDDPYSLPDPNAIEIIHGGARGADRAADSWAVHNYLRIKSYPANWEKYGKSAGYIRNKQMLDEGNPDLVVAFPGGKGTANMVKLAKEAGIEVREVKYNNA